ncbi:MAG: PTS sugar transporter subunit IIA [Gammaproteobacteria bacterium]|nr:PTS sugar transporter subunit IIA [Gammaproteobacteria bacterium]
MSELQQLLHDIAINCGVEVASKKKALEALSTLLGRSAETLNETQIFDSLLARERLGSTGLGHGIAIPHGRLADLQQTAGALLVLKDGVDFDAPDGQAVNILFGLLVPEACNDAHLQILAGLATMFSDADLRSALGACSDEAALRQAMLSWKAPSAASA